MAHRAIGNALKQFQPLHHRMPHPSCYGKALNILQARQFVRENRPKAEEHDGLSTWYDYIAYTCHLCAERATSLGRLQPEFDEAWTGLKGSVALEPFETLEYIRTRDGKLQQHAALRRAASELEAAKLALSKLVPSVFDSSDLEASRMRVPLPKRRLLAAAVKRVKETQAGFNVAKERDRHYVAFYLQTRDHKNTQDDLERLLRHMDWALGQITLIEAETDQSKSTGHDQKLDAAEREILHTTEVWKMDLLINHEPQKSRSREHSQRKLLSCVKPNPAMSSLQLG
ncbi:hypothetical protein PG988_004655 [Apiospora saccharicola]